MSDAPYRITEDRFGASIVSFAKWWFDLLRSFFVVALLTYVGRKTENIYLNIAGTVSLVLFIMYVAIHLMDLAYKPTELALTINNRSVKLLLLLVLIAVTTGVTTFGVGVIFEAFDQVIKHQLK